MIVLGALLNGIEALIGALIGLAFKRHVSNDLGDFLLKGQGLCVVLVAVQGMAAKGGNIVVVTLAVALGGVIGWMLGIDAAVHRLGDWVQARLDKVLPTDGQLGSFSVGFVNATLFCCTGAMAIVGSLASGLSLDHSTLIAKGIIDLVVCIPMAASMGVGVPFVALSLFVYEGFLSLEASLIAPLLTQAVIAEMSVTGSLLLFAVGTNLLGITQLKVADFLPACFLPIVLVPLVNLLPLV
ncbi:MAG: DUF554 domain-containing protein [Coriobacteriaceae bacterium]|nr:DUF554 domain-containing protein [Coriobacteriaceae bacterium]